MLLMVALGWMYVVLMMALAQALAPQGSVTGALLGLAFYGVLPVALGLWLVAAAARRRGAQAADESAPQPDGGCHAAGDAVAAKREEP